MQDRWETSEKGKVLYEWVKDVRMIEAQQHIDPGLSLGNLLRGHGSMNAFLHARHLSKTSECRCDNGVEDWEHVLYSCTLYEDL